MSIEDQPIMPQSALHSADQVAHSGHLPATQGGEYPYEDAESIRTSLPQIPDASTVDAQGEPIGLYATSPAQAPAPTDERGFMRRHRGAMALGASVAALAAAGGAYLASQHGDGSPKKPQPVAVDTPNATVSHSSAQPTNNTENSPTTVPSAIETVAPGIFPDSGGVDLAVQPAAEHQISLEGDTVHILTAAPNASGLELLSAFLSQDAYTLYRGIKTGGEPSGFEANVEKVKVAMSNNPTVLNQLQENVNQWVGQVGTSGETIPIYWGAAVKVTKTVDPDGSIHVVMTPDSSPVYLNTITVGAPDSLPNPVWQDPRGENIATARKVTGIELTFSGVTAAGTANLTGWSWHIS